MKELEERVIQDLNVREFISNFFSPYDPDSLDYMCRELVTLKGGEEIQSYRDAFEELFSNSSLYQQVEDVVKLYTN
jgi:hypothetical protein